MRAFAGTSGGSFFDEREKNFLKMRLFTSPDCLYRQKGGNGMNSDKQKEFDKIYERNINTVYAIAMLYLKNKNDAEDAAQNVFMNYLTAEPEFKDRNHEKAWFITAVRNHCRNITGHWWNRGRVTETREESSVSVFADEPDGMLTEALMSLPDKYRELLYLFYYEEYSVREISAIAGIKESTVRTRLQRGREQLRKKIEKEETADGKTEVIGNV